MFKAPNRQLYLGAIQVVGADWRGFSRKRQREQALKPCKEESANADSHKLGSYEPIHSTFGICGCRFAIHHGDGAMAVA
jgi:hypothetical protein